MSCKTQTERVMLTDVDECDEDTAQARCPGTDDVCFNTRGGFRCVAIKCPTGFVRRTPSIPVRSRSRSL